MIKAVFKSVLYLGANRGPTLIQGIRTQIVKSNPFLRQRRGYTKFFGIIVLLSIDMGIYVLETIFRIIYVFGLYFIHQINLVDFGTQNDDFT